MTTQDAVAACGIENDTLVRPQGWRGSGTALKVRPGMETFLKVTPLNLLAYTGRRWTPTIKDLLSSWELVTMETLLEEVKEDDSGKRHQEVL